ncbi:MAG: hypothetical protein CMH56_12240 [Myxococcales bacterium]|nr:hypothetical protein [Myxococcales bacterium]
MKKQEDKDISRWRRHATGITMLFFFGFCGLLGVLPIPENWRPIDFQQDNAAQDLWARISAKPKMYLVSTPSDFSDSESDAFELTDTNEANTVETAVANASPPSAVGEVAVPHDDVIAYKSKDGDGFKRPVYRPTARAKQIWKGANQLGAPGGFFQNPCLAYDSAGCSRTAMDDFYRALDEVHQKRPGARAGVVALGNSLIASDHITDIVRFRLTEMFGESGQGFLLVDRLGKIAGRRARTGYSSGDWLVHTIIKEKPEYPHFGLFGVHHETHSPNAQTAWRLRGETLAEVFWLDHPQGGSFYLEADGKFLGRIQSNHPSGFRSRISEFEVPSDAKKLRLIAEGAKVIVDGVALSKNQPGITFDTIGIPAATAKRYLNTNQKAFDIQLHARDPNLVILMVGGNEVRDLAWNRLSIPSYKKQYAQVIDRLKKAAPGASCLGVSPIDVVKVIDGGRTILTRREIYDIIEAQKTVAVDKGCAYFNIFEAMGGSGSLAKLHEMGLLLGDYVHPKGKGGDILGEIFARSLLENYTQTPLPGRFTLKPKVAPRDKKAEVIEEPKEAPEQLKRGGNLDEFIAQLLALKQGEQERVAIGQFGGDLIAAQFFSDRIRQRMAERFGNRGRGYVSIGPFSRRLFKTGVVRHLEGSTEIIDGRRLLYGGAVSPVGLRTRMQPGALFEVTFCAGCTEPIILPQTTLELAWLRTPDMGVADLYLDGEPLLSLHKDLVSSDKTDIHFTKVRATGMEHTLSILVRDDEDLIPGTHSRNENITFVRRGHKGPVHLLSISAEIEQPGVVLDALGASQAGPEHFSRWRKDLLAEQISRRDYDLLIFGWDRVTQNARHQDIDRYQKDYVSTIERLRDMQPGAACVLLGPTFQGRVVKSEAQRRAFAQTERSHRAMAEQTECAYFSLAEAMGGLENMRKWEGQGWTLPGGARLSESGYVHLADQFTKDIFLLFDRERFERQRADAHEGLGPTRFAALNSIFNFFTEE